MKVVFLGTPTVAVPTLAALHDAGHEIAAVVTRPDRPAGRSGRARPSAVKVAALDRSLELLQPDSLRDAAFRSRLRSIGADAVVVVAFGRMLGRFMREHARLGAVNVHFSLLPAYRGAAPVQWALARGERVTGVSTMRLSRGMDEGDVYLRREVPVEPDEHAPALAARLSEHGAELLLETLRGLEEGTLSAAPQDARRATYAPMLRPEDGRVAPTLPAAAIVGRIRGFDPWPGVWMRAAAGRLRLVEGRLHVADAPDDVAVGELWRDGDAVVLRCADAGLALRTVQFEGKRRMPVSDAINGRLLAIGERLEAP